MGNSIVSKLNGPSQADINRQKDIEQRGQELFNKIKRPTPDLNIDQNGLDALTNTPLAELNYDERLAAQRERRDAGALKGQRALAEQNATQAQFLDDAAYFAEQRRLDTQQILRLNQIV